MLKRSFLGPLAAALALCGCATVGGGGWMTDEGRAMVSDPSGAVLSAGCWSSGGYFSVQWPKSVAEDGNVIGHLSLDGGVTMFDMALDVSGGGKVTTTKPSFYTKRWADKMGQADKLLFRVGKTTAHFDLHGAGSALSQTLAPCS